MSSETETKHEAERAGKSWTSDDHAQLNDWVSNLPFDYIIEGSDYDKVAKEMQRTAGAIRLNIFSKAAMGAPEDETLLQEFVKFRAKTWHIPEEDLLRYIIKRQNEKRNGAKPVTSSGDTGYQALVVEITVLRDKIDRLTLLVQQLQTMLNKK
jgi:hypothetical protein